MKMNNDIRNEIKEQIYNDCLISSHFHGIGKIWDITRNNYYQPHHISPIIDSVVKQVMEEVGSLIREQLYEK